MKDLEIRSVRITDAQDISDIRKMDGVIQYIFASKDEKVEKIEKKISSKSDNEKWFVGDVQGKVVGVAILNRYVNPKKSHVGSITIVVNPKYHGFGIGKSLIERLISLANDEIGLIRLELEVFSNNHKAIGLYRKFGFIIEGKKEKAAFIDGEYIDEVIMGKILGTVNKISE